MNALVLATLLAQVPIVIETELGPMEATLDDKRAPATTANFLLYVDAKLYDGGLFHRTVKTSPDNQPQSEIKIDVIQAGPAPQRREQDFPPIALERTSKTGLRHRNGTISMARSGPDTATGDFFICIGEQASLDFGGLRNPDAQGFAAFGQITAGMDIVKKIQQSPAEAQRLMPPIKILRIKRK